MMEKYIEKTKNFPGMKLSVSGLTRQILNSKGRISNHHKVGLEEISRLYYEGREAWLKGDLDTVAELFGILT